MMIAWLRAMLRRDHEPGERARKGAEVRELHTESAIVIDRADRALRAQAERDNVAAAVRRTVRAVRREPLT